MNARDGFLLSTQANSEVMPITNTKTTTTTQDSLCFSVAFKSQSDSSCFFGGSARSLTKPA